MNDLDIVLMTAAELELDLDLVARREGYGKTTLGLARKLARWRKDLRVQYLPKAVRNLIAPCLCVKTEGAASCPGCKRLDSRRADERTRCGRMH